jgi:hypothetical protein
LPPGSRKPPSSIVQRPTPPELEQAMGTKQTTLHVSLREACAFVTVRRTVEVRRTFTDVSFLVPTQNSHFARGKRSVGSSWIPKERLFFKRENHKLHPVLSFTPGR